MLRHRELFSGIGHAMDTVGLHKYVHSLPICVLSQIQNTVVPLFSVLGKDFYGGGLLWKPSGWSHLGGGYQIQSSLLLDQRSAPGTFICRICYHSTSELELSGSFRHVPWFASNRSSANVSTPLQPRHGRQGATQWITEKISPGEKFYASQKLFVFAVFCICCFLNLFAGERAWRPNPL